MKDIGIYINSSGRAKLVHAVKKFPQEWKKFTQIIVPFKQKKEYENSLDWPIIGLPKEIPSFLAPQRKWVCDNSRHQFIFTIDDDVLFEKRDKLLKLRKATYDEMNEMLELIYKEVKEKKIPQVGISTRLGNNRVEEDYEDIARATRAYCYNREIILREKINFSPFNELVMDDFHITLCLLKKGYLNRIYYSFAQSDFGSNTEGGCSLYRNFEVMKKNTQFMLHEHRGFVKIKMKKTKNSWEGFPRDENGNYIRIDLIIFWKKAYQSFLDKKMGISHFFK